MLRLVHFASPWWVNLLILVPALVWVTRKVWRISPGRGRLPVTAVFGVAFALVEAAVVVYLRAASGMLAARGAAATIYVPENLLGVERWREAATMVMLAAVAWLAGRNWREKSMVFLWVFAFWDLFYYVWLRVTIGWPASLFDGDILFLIPEPWVGQVWFPILVSLLTIVAIGIRAGHGAGAGSRKRLDP